MITELQDTVATSSSTETPVTTTPSVQVTTGVDLDGPLNPTWTQLKLPSIPKEKVKSAVINTEGFTLLRLKPATSLYPTAVIKNETGEFYMTASALGRLFGLDKSNFTRMWSLAPEDQKAYLRSPRKLAFIHGKCLDTVTNNLLPLSNSTLEYNPRATSYYYTKEGIKYMLNQPTVQKHLDACTDLLKNYIHNEFYTRFLMDNPLPNNVNRSAVMQNLIDRAQEDVALAAAQKAALETAYTETEPHIEGLREQRTYVRAGARALVDNIEDLLRSVDALTVENDALRQQLQAQPQVPVVPEYDNATATAEDKLKHSIYISEKYGDTAFSSEWLSKCGWLTSESIYNMPVPNLTAPRWTYNIGGKNRITLSVFQAIVRSIFLKGSSYPFNKVKQAFVDNGMVRNFYVACPKKPYPGPVLQADGCVASPETPAYDTNSHPHIQPSTRYNADAVEYLRKNWHEIVTDYMADTMVLGANSINAKYEDDQEEVATSE